MFLMITSAETPNSNFFHKLLATAYKSENSLEYFKSELKTQC